MNKVITINLGGRAYQLEESGFDALRAYLDDAAARLEGDPGKSEIIADLEQAIGEKCDKVLSPHKSVVLTDEINRIIAEMGPVEGEAKTNGSEKQQAGTNAEANAPKRLYRIEEGAMIWGVCTGLAAYFNVDVTLVRIIFVLLTILTGGGFCFAYFAMMILIPEANTAEAMAQAHGEPFNAKALMQRTKERISESYERVTGGKLDWNDLNKMHTDHKQWKQLRKEQRRAWKRQWKRGRRSNPVFGMLRGSLAALWIVALLSLVTTGAIFGFVFPGVPTWVTLVGLFIIYFAVSGPLRGAQYAPYWQGDKNGSNYFYDYSEWDGLVDSLVVLFLVIAFIWAYTSVPIFYEFVHHPIAGAQHFIGYLQSLGAHL